MGIPALNSSLFVGKCGIDSNFGHHEVDKNEGNRQFGILHESVYTFSWHFGCIEVSET